MSEITRNAEGFVAYDYKEVNPSSLMEPVVADGLCSFGWELDTTTPRRSLGFASLRFRRDRRIRNKAELSRLQRQFEVGVAEIEALERSKATSASIVAFTVGIIGCAFLAGSVFALLAGMVVGMIVLAVPGLVCWALPYLLFTRMRQRRTASVTPLIEAKYDELFEGCKSASELLSAHGV